MGTGGEEVNKALFRMAVLRAGYTQTQLAKELGVSKNTLSNKVNGRVNVTVVEAQKICEILHITDNVEKAQIFLT